MLVKIDTARIYAFSNEKPVYLSFWVKLWSSDVDDLSKAAWLLEHLLLREFSK